MEQGDLSSGVRKVRSPLVRPAEGLGRILAASCVGVLLGVAGVWLLADELRPAFFPSAPPDAQVDAAQHSVSLEELGEILETEIRARLKLEGELSELREEMRRLRGEGAWDVEQRPSEVRSFDDPATDSVAAADTSRGSSLPESLGEDFLGAKGETRAKVDKVAKKPSAKSTAHPPSSSPKKGKRAASRKKAAKKTIRDKSVKTVVRKTSRSSG